MLNAEEMQVPQRFLILVYTTRDQSLLLFILFFNMTLYLKLFNIVFVINWHAVKDDGSMTASGVLRRLRCVLNNNVR